MAAMWQFLVLQFDTALPACAKFYCGHGAMLILDCMFRRWVTIHQNVHFLQPPKKTKKMALEGQRGPESKIGKK